MQNHFQIMILKVFLRFRGSMLGAKIDLGGAWRPLEGLLGRLGGVQRRLGGLVGHLRAIWRRLEAS